MRQANKDGSIVHGKLEVYEENSLLLLRPVATNTGYSSAGPPPTLQDWVYKNMQSTLNNVETLDFKMQDLKPIGTGT